MILILIKIQNLCVIVEHYLGMEPFAMFINVDEVEVVRSVNRPKFTTHFNLCFQNIPIFVLQIDDTLIIANLWQMGSQINLRTLSTCLSPLPKTKYIWRIILLPHLLNSSYNFNQICNIYNTQIILVLLHIFLVLGGFKGFYFSLSLK